MLAFLLVFDGFLTSQKNGGNVAFVFFNAIKHQS